MGFRSFESFILGIDAKEGVIGSQDRFGAMNDSPGLRIGTELGKQGELANIIREFFCTSNQVRSG